MRTAAVILAAGASSRMGGPKQVVEYGGVSLLRRAAMAALEAGCEPVVVVTGAHAELSRRELRDLAVQVVDNPEWPTGMASSLRAGVLHVATHPDAQALIVMLCDQPHVGADLLRTLIAAHASTGKPIIACGYAGTLGVPALFARALWPECTALTGAAGAKHIIETDGSRVHVTPFPDGAIDIDTPADLARLHGR
jgi:molybdenum cofactor cytidylyltransferase